MKSVGVCKFCKKEISSRGMMRHIKSCRKRKQANEKQVNKSKIFLLRACIGQYFVYFEIPAAKTLGDVDSFLRKHWLECCGHLSAFKIDEQSYSSYPQEEFRNKSMNKKLDEVISPGKKFSHEYDFGTTTYLELECVSQRYGNLKNIEILTRNNPLEIKCDYCEKQALKICTECMWDQGGFLCKDCIKTHKCDEYMLLPVVNSPRMGMCGYTGQK
ncbi:hypothetical protein GF327_02505 [Candidatus Woesearchaeota archaeon]|nr:hypothetical protein [Candidatus Woesearchaeota archaeon]